MASKKEIQDILLKLDVMPSLFGFKYITEAVKLILECDTHYKICDLYKDVAVIHKTTPSRVERSIRHIFKDQIDYSQSLARKYLSKQGMTNGKYLYLLAFKIQGGQEEN